MPLLSLAQLLGWGALYYAFGLLIEPLTAELSMSRPAVAGAFSLALLISGLAAWPVGMLIDRGHGRAVMSAGSLLAAAGLALHAMIGSPWQLYAVWLLLGLSMSMCLYEPAFALLIRAYPDDYRQRIAVLTVLGGLAGTVFWPLVAWLLGRMDWRATLQVLAAIQLLACLPIHLLATPPEARGSARRRSARAPSHEPSHEPLHEPVRTASRPTPAALARRAADSPLRSPVFLLLMAFFATNLLVMAGLHAHLPGMLQAQGLPLSTTLLVASCMGPAQVVGRLLLLAGDRARALTRHADRSAWLPPLALASLAGVGLAVDTLGPAAGAALGVAGALLYGAGNGMLTIVKGTAVADLVGPAQVATLNGIAAAPSAVARAIGPFAVAWIWEHGDRPALSWLALLVCSMASALLFARARQRAGKR